MARARNIKPGFFKNELLVEQPAFVRLLFIGLWTLADREGRIEDRPKRIKLELFPYDSDDVASALDLLASTGFIHRYSAGGKDVIQILTFLKHQAPHGTEKDSELPDAEGCLTVHDRDKNGYVVGVKRKNNVKLPEINVNPPVLPVNPPLDNALNPDSLNPESLFTDSVNPDLAAPAKAAAKKGTRLPDDWVLPTELAEWAIRERPGYPILLEAAKFRDFWLAKSGKDATKADWPATWRNWVRNTRMGTQDKPQRHSGFEARNYHEGVKPDGSF